MGVKSTTFKQKVSELLADTVRAQKIARAGCCNDDAVYICDECKSRYYAIENYRLSIIAALDEWKESQCS